MCNTNAKTEIEISAIAREETLMKKKKKEKKEKIKRSNDNDVMWARAEIMSLFRITLQQ